MAPISLANVIGDPSNRRMLIKIDIEGAEYPLARDFGWAARELGASVLLSLHPENLTAETGQAADRRRREMAAELLSALDGGHSYHWTDGIQAQRGSHHDLMDTAARAGGALKSVFVQGGQR